MTKPRQVKTFSLTLFEDQFERIKNALEKLGFRGNVSNYVRQLLDKELENFAKVTPDSEAANETNPL